MSIIKANAWQFNNGTPVGTIIQVVQTVKSDTFSTTSDTPVDITGFSATITPRSSSSKILVFFNMALRAFGNQGYCNVTILRGSSTIFTGYAVEGNSNDQRGMICWTYLDSPATTSPVTYKAQMDAGFADTIYLNSTTSPSTIVLMEVQA
jgi:hypothetical protein